MAELGAALAAGLGLEVAGSVHLGAIRLSPEAPLEGTGVVHGSIIGLGIPIAEATAPLAPLELAVIGGPAAGAVDSFCRWQRPSGWAGRSTPASPSTTPRSAAVTPR